MTGRPPVRTPDVNLSVDFCGELFAVPHDRPWIIGRKADLSLDEDNPYLHRRFLQFHRTDGYWWLSNIGTIISANVADTASRAHTWLAPGAAVPVTFAQTIVVFSAGPTTYELTIQLEDAPFSTWSAQTNQTGVTTIGVPSLTVSQHLLILALAEPALRRQGQGAIQIPPSAAAAKRLGWTQTRFNRKLDNVCDRLTKHGVRGLHGGPGQLTSDRRTRLVEFSLATGLITAEQLPLLDHRDAEDHWADGQ